MLLSVHCQLRAQSGRETVYLHFDRTEYDIGETAWFRAYVVSDHQFSGQSTVLWTDLLDPSGNLVQRVVSPLMNGLAVGHVDFSDTLSSGIFMIRSYTALMLSGTQTAVFEKPLRLTGNGIRPVRGDTARIRPGIRLDLYPESGTMLTGMPNRVAFRAGMVNGAPVHLRGSIVDDLGVRHAEAQTYHDGRGLFILTPDTGRTYHFIFDTLDAQFSFPLPDAKPDGIMLKVMPHPDGFVIELHDRSVAPERRAGTITGTMQGRSVFGINIPPERRSLKAIVRTDPETIRSGILELTVLNREGIPLAGRLVFVRQPGLTMALALEADTISFRPKSSNVFKLSWKDTISGSLSVSVTDQDETSFRSWDRSLLSQVLLDAELPGVIEHPDWYFMAEQDSSMFGLDLLMMTNGWSRYDWKKIKPVAPLPANTFRDPAYISIEGVLPPQVRPQPAGSKNIMMMMNGPQFGKRAEYPVIGEKGRFRIDSLLYFGNAGLSFFDMSVKKGKPLDVRILSASPDTAFLRAFPVKWTSRKRPAYLFKASDGQGMYPQPGMFDTAKLLKEVVVNARKKTPTQRLNEQYSTGFFSDGETRLLDLVNGPDPLVQQNIFDYLKFRVPGLMVADPNYEVASTPGLGDDPFNDPGGYRLFYRQQPTISSMGNIPMVIYLNEVQTSPSVIATIPANQIVLIKVFSSFAPAPGGGAGGALAIYTKDPSFSTSGNTSMPLFYKGFSVIREFAAPDYDRQPEKRKEQDLRKTLLWKPEVILSKDRNSVRIRFHGNDDPKHYRVRIEGMTVDGRYMHVDKEFKKP